MWKGLEAEQKLRLCFPLSRLAIPAVFYTWREPASPLQISVNHYQPVPRVSVFQFCVPRMASTSLCCHLQMA